MLTNEFNNRAFRLSSNKMVKENHKIRTVKGTGMPEGIVSDIYGNGCIY